VATSRRNEGSDLGARVLAAVPLIAFAVVIVWKGGTLFAIGIALLGVMACAELFRMMKRAHPPFIAGDLAVIALVFAARFGDRETVLLIFVISVPVVFFFTVLRPNLRDSSWGMAVVFMGIIWIGLAVSHAMLLRKLPHGGGLVVDTGAYFAGRSFWTRQLSPRLSPNKTIEGLIGGILIGTLAFWAAGLYQNWLNGVDALIIGACVAVAAPVGDLFESLIKRDNGVKDTGHVFGAHGGVLDRLDAVFFTVVTAYYVALAVL
jgi:phosphatidate cytidylyltransferase